MATATVEGSWVTSEERPEIIGRRQYKDKELEARLTGEKVRFIGTLMNMESEGNYM